MKLNSVEFVGTSRCNATGTDSDEIIEGLRDEFIKRRLNIDDYVLCSLFDETLYILIRENSLKKCINMNIYNYIDDYSVFYNLHSEDIFKQLNKYITEEFLLSSLTNFYDPLVACVYHAASVRMNKVK